MKFPLLFTLLALATGSVAQTTPVASALPAATQKTIIVEASCGQCRLGLPGKSCDLAIRLNGQAYFVDGTTIDSHGDAHAKDGFCSAIRQAEVQGAVVDNRFKATYFRLLPEVKKEK
ncbi:hypothetical protein SAMN02745146_3530 [Hymenobacter daecheongensis DSM 21074]|uniref:Glutaminyl-tRNA synthetase n=1 Tax=Hymenobacter daecheongensis DSM 21074 TaxID=1121955 RepID=A0A1M6KQV7_9BACT|nr:DUF6370 family protein [Hymenobacter daecheongensis]SHJ61264.1 hypothetical protein SAMN02745146_3530 [Hymenobacter daecheongensis DSM 21074]